MPLALFALVIFQISVLHFPQSSNLQCDLFVEMGFC
jgi:hypothetical protein